MAPLEAQPRGYSLPIVDLSRQLARRIIVDREEGRYLGQPDTVLLADGRSILVGYPRGHGGPDTILKRSDDGGDTLLPKLISGELRVPDAE